MCTKGCFKYEYIDRTGPFYASLIQYFHIDHKTLKRPNTTQNPGTLPPGLPDECYEFDNGGIIDPDYEASPGNELIINSE